MVDLVVQGFHLAFEQIEVFVDQFFQEGPLLVIGRVKLLSNLLNFLKTITIMQFFALEVMFDASFGFADRTRTATGYAAAYLDSFEGVQFAEGALLAIHPLGVDLYKPFRCVALIIDTSDECPDPLRQYRRASEAGFLIYRPAAKPSVPSLLILFDNNPAAVGLPGHLRHLPDRLPPRRLHPVPPAPALARQMAARCLGGEAQQTILLPTSYFYVSAQ